ncbi:hypothetical protein, partial [Prevotella sp. MGM1]|uniref:hypothetical protein n=1 Tax=Prevotella sp. MGM1 TaxID=2033405 RepID=UPI000D0C349F
EPLPAGANTLGYEWSSFCHTVMPSLNVIFFYPTGNGTVFAVVCVWGYRRTQWHGDADANIALCLRESVLSK